MADSTPDPDFKPGLEGVIAFESTIAEPDKEGGALRYRGVDINDLVGHVDFAPRVGPARRQRVRPRACRRPSPIPCRCTPATYASTSSPRSPCSPRCGASSRRSTSTPSEVRDNLARAAVMALSFVGQSARGPRQADGPAERGRQGPHHHRALHDPLARRARPEARRGRRRLLGLRRRARHERLDVHRPRHHLDRRRRRRRPLGRGRRDVRPAPRRRARRACSTCSTASSSRATRRPTSRASSTRASA